MLPLLEVLKLVGFDQQHRVYDVDNVVHFLLARLDAQACMMVCRGCWPIIEVQRDGRQFRLAATKVFLGWKKENKVKSVVRQGILDEPWGTGRLLYALLCELLLMVMKRECGGDKPTKHTAKATLIEECETLKNQIEKVKSKTDDFLKTHPIINVEMIDHDECEVVDRLNDIVSFEPMMVVSDCKSVAFLSNCSLDAFLVGGEGLLKSMPKVPTPHTLHNRCRDLERVLEEKHKILTSLHSQLDDQQSRPDWNIENESMNLIP